MTELAERPVEDRTETLEPFETAETVDPADPGHCVAVVCPDFAAEASYFAAGLARRLADREPPTPAARGSARVALVDGLPGTGPLDVLTDLDTLPGARWPVLRGAEGAIDAARLLRALPRREGVAVLAHERSFDVVERGVRARTLRALADSVEWVVGTQPPDRLPDDAFESVVLLVRGSVGGLAAAQRYVDHLGDETPVAMVLLETPAANRALVADSLGRALVSAAPTRWRLAQTAGPEVVAGSWPGASDRVFRKVLDEVVVYLCSHGRSTAWV